MTNKYKDNTLEERVRDLEEKNLELNKKELEHLRKEKLKAGLNIAMSGAKAAGAGYIADFLHKTIYSLGPQGTEATTEGLRNLIGLSFIGSLVLTFYYAMKVYMTESDFSEKRSEYNQLKKDLGIA